MLYIRLLGPPLIEHDEQPLRIQRRIPRALLFYLAAVGAPVARGELIFLFWPEEEDEKAREHLRDNLAKLRAALPDPNLIQTTPDTIGLEFAHVSVDVLNFRRLLHQIGSLPRHQTTSGLLPAAAYYALTEAVRLWRANNFLAGSALSISASLDEWLSRTDHLLQTDFQRALERLAEHELLAGNFEKALQWLQRASDIDPYNEELHLQRLKAMLNMGAYREALQHITDLRQLLKQDLGIDPGEAILQVERRLTLVTRPLTSTSKASWPLRPTVQIPFVGQNENLDQLQGAFRKGGGVILFGEAGAGKTRLVQEFYQRLGSPPRLLIGSCRPTESNLPYQPWVEMLRRDIGRDEWMRLPSVWASQLSVLVPELVSLRTDLPPTPDASSDQMRAVLFEAIRSLLETIIENWPVLVFIDNVHWGDEASLDVLAYLLEHGVFASGNGLLVMAARSEEANPFLDRLLLSSSPALRVQTLEVSRLKAEDVAELSHHFLGQRPPQRLLDRLTADTGGNPFFLLETLQVMSERAPELDLNAVETLPMAGSVHQLIQSRLQRLAAPTRDLLMAAAVLGNEFEVAVLEKVTSAAPEQIALALEELENTRLLLSASDGSELRYLFVHEKIRESILQEVSPARKRVLHARVARALASHFVTQKDRFAALLASHYEEAGAFPEAFDFWVQAGQYAQRLSSFNDARAAFSRAERLIPRSDTFSDEEINRLYTEWGEMLYEINDPTTLRRINQTLMRIATERRSDLLIGKALDGLAQAEFTDYNFEAGLEYANQALPHLMNTTNLYSQMEALTHRGLFLYMLNRIDDAQEVFREALVLVPETDDPLLLRARGHANYRMAMAYILTGWPKEAQRYGEQSLRDYTQAGRLYGQVAAHVVLSQASHSLGDFATGYRIAREGIALAERIAAWRMLGNLHICCSMHQLDLGQLGPAWESAQKAAALGTRYHHNDLISDACRACGDIYRHLGDFDQAVSHYKEGVESSGKHFAGTENLLRMGFALLQKGEAIGESYFQQALRRATQMRQGMVTFYAQGAQLLVQAGRRQFETIKKELKGFRQEASTRGWQLSLLLADYVEALTEYDLENLTMAEMRCRSMIQAGLAMSCPRAELRGLILLTHMLRELKRPTWEADERIQAILANMEASVAETPLKEAWREYRNQVLAALG
ncbi:MAG: AAA family ATPase [Anaerolineales bacterium]|nr:AAA family ATPase [Anaerolineales bacterium]